MKNNKTARKIRIKGIVTPTDWDDDGNVTEVALATASEDEYFLDGGKPMQKLLMLVGEEVVVSGTVGSEKKRGKTIMVENYELIGDEIEEEEEEFSDEEYPEDEDFDEDEEEW